MYFEFVFICFFFSSFFQTGSTIPSQNTISRLDFQFRQLNWKTEFLSDGFKPGFTFHRVNKRQSGSTCSRFHLVIHPKTPSKKLAGGRGREGDEGKKIQATSDDFSVPFKPYKNKRKRAMKLKEK